MKEIHWDSIIKDAWTEPNHPQQNLVEGGAIKYLKSRAKTLMKEAIMENDFLKNLSPQQVRHWCWWWIVLTSVMTRWGMLWTRCRRWEFLTDVTWSEKVRLSYKSPFRGLIKPSFISVLVRGHRVLSLRRGRGAVWSHKGGKDSRKPWSRKGVKIRKATKKAFKFFLSIC